MLLMLVLQVEAGHSRKMMPLTIVLPTTYIKSTKKKPLIKDLDIKQTPIVDEVEAGVVTELLIKGLNAEHTAYYLDDLPLPTSLKGCEARLDKLPTMVTKGNGLAGAMIYTLPKNKFQTTMGVSTNAGMQNHTNFHTEKNNHFFTGEMIYNNDGGWNRTPWRYRQSGIKNKAASLEGVFQTGHQDAEQNLTISSVNQYMQGINNNLNLPDAFDGEENESFFNLLGVSYERQNWRGFTSLYGRKTTLTQQSGTQNIVLTAGVCKTESTHHFGVFTQQINNHKVYQYDVYGGKKIGPFYPSARLIKTERHILCPFDITTQLAKPLKIVCGSAYRLPNDLELFSPFGNADLKPEHNYHCNIIHSFERSNWTVEQTLFINHVTNLIEFSLQTNCSANIGNLNTVGIDQSIGYDGFDRYKIGYSHTYCTLDGSQPVLSRPAWKFLVWQRFYLSDACFIDLRAHFKGPYLSGDRETWKPKEMPGVFLLDVSTTHVLNKNWTVLCEIKNLTNRHYESPHGYLGKGIEAWVRFVYTI